MRSERDDEAVRGLDVTQKVMRYTSEEIHRTLFVTPPVARRLSELKDGLRRHIKK